MLRRQFSQMPAHRFGHRLVLGIAKGDFGRDELDRVMKAVTGEPGMVPGRNKVQHLVSGGMARRRQDRHPGAERPCPLHQIGQPRRQHRRDAAFENAVVIGKGRMPGGVAAPAVNLGLLHDVARIGKGRHPLAVAQLRVPAAMVVMQVRADDQIDVLRPVTRLGQALDEGNVQPVEERHRMRLAVAGTRIDQHHAIIRLENPALEDQIEHVLRI